MSASMMLRNNVALFKGQSTPIIALRSLSSLTPSERKADFAPRIISQKAFPDVEIQKLRRGTGGRSSFNGLIVTVFGASGFLGRSVVNALSRIGTQVIVPYRCDPYFVRSRKLAGDLGQVLFVPFHLRDTKSVAQAMQHSNVVINLIGRDDPTVNFDYESVHVEGARTIARIARESGIKRLIHVSTLNSSPNPPAYYIKGGSGFYKSKYAGELAVREEFPDATIFRPADMYGVQDKYLWYYCMFHRRGYRKFPLANGGYGITKRPVSVSDVAQGIVNAISDEESIGRDYDAVGPRRYELRMMMEYLNEIIDKKPWNGGFKITNLNWDPLFRSRITMLSIMNKLFARKPVVTWEKIERETITDEKPKNQTLSDLGVKLTHIEDAWPHHLIVWRFDFNYEGDPGEKKLFTNPPYIVEP